MHHQCVATLAANSLHSGLFRASSIASSKVRLCRARSFFRVTRWPNSVSLLFCMIEVRGGCSVRRRTSQLETRWYQCMSRIHLRHHWSSASTFLATQQTSISCCNSVHFEHTKQTTMKLTDYTFAIPIEVAFSSGTPWFILSPRSQIPKSCIHTQCLHI